MAFESRYWRSKIKRDINYISKQLKLEVTSKTDVDKLFSEIEIRLFTIAYSLRKLMDSYKLPDIVSSIGIKVVRYKRNSKPFLPFSLSPERHYEESGTQSSLTLRALCDQFIHSDVFQIYLNEHNLLNTLFFTSDRDKLKCIYSIEINKLLEDIKKLVDKYPHTVIVTAAPNSNDYSIKNI